MGQQAYILFYEREEREEREETEIKKNGVKEIAKDKQKMEV
jgi:hypothetical protein